MRGQRVGQHRCCDVREGGEKGEKDNQLIRSSIIKWRFRVDLQERPRFRPPQLPAILESTVILALSELKLNWFHREILMTVANFDPSKVQNWKWVVFSSRNANDKSRGGSKHYEDFMYFRAAEPAQLNTIRRDEWA